MPTDLDIYRSANLLVQQHGAGAAAEADRRAEAMRAKGDAEGASVWRRVAAAAVEIQRQARQADQALH